MMKEDQKTRKYIEVIRYSDKEVVKRMDVSDKNDRAIDRIDSGININMNHEEYYTMIVESEKSLEVI